MTRAGCAMRVLLLLGALGLGLPTAAAASLGDLAAYVNPFVGTATTVPDFGTGGSAGNTFPGAVAPHGMVQWSPDTIPSTVNFAGGYSYGDSQLRGFSLTHISGPGCAALQDFPFLPTTAAVTSSPAVFGSSNIEARYVPDFDHAHEQSHPGSYRVELNPAGAGSKIDAELTAASARTSLGRFTYTASKPGSVLINAGGSAMADYSASVRIDPARRLVTGTAQSGEFCYQPIKYRLYFAAQFNRSFSAYGTWKRQTLEAGSRSSSDTASSPAAILNYKPIPGAPGPTSSRSPAPRSRIRGSRSPPARFRSTRRGPVNATSTCARSGLTAARCRRPGFTSPLSHTERGSASLSPPNPPPGARTRPHPRTQPAMSSEPAVASAPHHAAPAHCATTTTPPHSPVKLACITVPSEPQPKPRSVVGYDPTVRVGIRRAWPAVAALWVALTGAAATWAASAPSLQPVALPRDHGAHPAFQIEWWYAAGTVADHRGRQFFWFATVWSGMGGLVGRVNVVDLRADRTVLSKEYIAAGAPRPGQTELSVDGFRLGWQPNRRLGRWSIDARAPGRGRLQLSLIPARPYVLNGSHGIVQQGKGSASAYYSAPRLGARGTLVLAGHTSGVSGAGWLDHQWGNFATNSTSLHWNWFACQFRDGSDLMLYQFITPAARPTGVQSATFVPAQGMATHPRGFTVVALGPEIRPPGATGTYPLRWRLEVPSAHVSITIKARARHQFISNQFIPGFWEGAATITSGRPGACIVESTRETSAF